MSIAKDKASVKAAELKVKAKEKADRVDKESIKNKFGGFWKKIKREKDNEDGQEGKEQTGGKQQSWSLLVTPGFVPVTLFASSCLRQSRKGGLFLFFKAL